MKTKAYFILAETLVISLILILQQSCTTDYGVDDYGASDIDGYGTTTFEDCGTVNYGGTTYQTVVIGEQCWMKENLDYSTASGSWCYDNSSDNCDIYGKLYTWNTMMNGESSSNTVPSGVQGICPDGWHIPSAAEWDILVDYLGGSTVAGLKMKEAGTAHWSSLNINATNDSGFTALPGGFRADDGTFYYSVETVYWWSATEYGSPTASYYSLLHDTDGVTVSNYLKGGGMSVRCLQN